MDGPGRRKRYHPVDTCDRQWHALLAFALERADSFECALPYPVVVQDLARWPLWPQALSRFRTDVVDRHVTLIRWDELRAEPTQLVRLRLSPALVGWIVAPRRLDEWRWGHGMAEDPSFWRGDELLLATESRHGRIAVYADDFDLALLAGSGIRLLEPLGVRAAPWPTP